MRGPENHRGAGSITRQSCEIAPETSFYVIGIPENCRRHPLCYAWIDGGINGLSG
jgi:hypothetical protein